MPELPEVETARRFVDDRALHSKVVRSEVLDLRMLESGLPADLDDMVRGQEVLATDRHGKNLFICFERGVLHIHLGMSGSVLFSDDEDHHSPHERLRMHLNHGVLILDDPRRFGRFGRFDSMADFVVKKGLGPDALSIDRSELIGRLRGRTGAIKAVLLNQRVVAGLGNLYVDEILFQEGIRPTTPTCLLSVDRLGDLWGRTRDVLNTSIDARTEFDRLPPGFLVRHRTIGGACPRCSGKLVGTMVGGRTTVFCPECQINWAKEER
jgi:formamidopyrimidine-DNA glycosylase